MYLDDDARVLCNRIDKWFKPVGELFLRESCVSASNPNRPHSHAHYGGPEFYLFKNFLFYPEGTW